LSLVRVTTVNALCTFSTAIDAGALPARFPDPFDSRSRHPLTQRAAQEVQRTLVELPAWRLDAPGGGKMFGVLVVQTSSGDIGYLRAFSGMMQGQWAIDGWAPPVFDEVAVRAFWPAGEAALNAMTRIRAAMRFGSATLLSELDTARAERSNLLLSEIQSHYRFVNVRGEARSVRDLFAPSLPPGGAGDCAAPKLLQQAITQGMRPIALAEFWWGAPPRDGSRRSGHFYPPCRGKCVPILTHLLDGLDVAWTAAPGALRVDADAMRVIHEDASVVVIEKASGLLSVPGRGAALSDSVLTRVRERYPDADGPLLVHRLDLDTSGLLLMARTHTAFVALQRQFAARTVEKEYVAVVDGALRADRGMITLPLRVDPDDRPRQVHDPVHGKAAVTEWRRLSGDAMRTRVVFVPRTGRTHQLRVHASHPLGLNAPIVGDRLYGRDGGTEERMLLHAARLAFVHPVSGERMTVESPPEF
jgi:tRNA pseudouridine32 synthase / 23S rRNA pseudouridine746 synthase